MPEQDPIDKGTEIGHATEVREAKEAKKEKDAKDAQDLATKMLDVFAKTGHDSLRALLLVSAGSVVVFLPFFGALICADRFGLKTALGFEDTFLWFVRSVVFCLLCYALSFLSHASYYHKKNRLGNWLTVGAFVLGLFSIGSIGYGGFSGWRGLKALEKADPPPTEMRIIPASEMRINLSMGGDSTIASPQNVGSKRPQASSR
ncbi:MAG TPA: hypothetical protein VJW75_10915 [Candidatus Eisenbacteria bacterium]|nr:hypothetical protein [Candidatus Eisenbacteria bacterium]